MSQIDETIPLIPVRIAVLTVSDTRDEKSDKSGALLASMIEQAGHRVAGRAIVFDDIKDIRKQVKKWIKDDGVDVVISTGGTGFAKRDVTPEALKPLFAKEIDGFSALFHMVSFKTIGTSTVQSRACGGMVTTNNKELADTVAMLRVHGSRVRYVHEAIGINSRLDALQAAVLSVKLKYLDQWAEGRLRNAARYRKLFADGKLLERVTLPVVEAANHHVFNQFTVRVPKRDQLRAHLKAKGVGTEVYYPLPMHLQNCYRDLGYQKGSFPVSEQAAAEVLSLPIYAELKEDQLIYVVESIADFYRQ